MCFEIIPVYIEFSIYSFCLLILAIIQISGENTAMYFRYGINKRLKEPFVALKGPGL